MQYPIQMDKYAQKNENPSTTKPNKRDETKVTIYIVTHRPLFDEFYASDDSLEQQWLQSVEVGNSRSPRSSFVHKNFCLSDLYKYQVMGKRWAEFEAIYNLHINGLCELSDYIGFIHYDYYLHNGACSQIKDAILNRSEFISFSTFEFIADYRQRIAMDDRNPNTLIIGGKSCYKKIVEHYNTFFGKDYKVLDLWDKDICLCNAFAMPRDGLAELMAFLAWVYESKLLDGYDSTNRYRAQGGFIERYVGVYSAFKQITRVELKHWYDYPLKGTSKS